MAHGVQFCAYVAGLSILLRIFMSILIRDIGTYFFFPCNGIVGFDKRIILALRE